MYEYTSVTLPVVVIPGVIVGINTCKVPIFVISCVIVIVLINSCNITFSCNFMCNCNCINKLLEYYL